jgi:hypothetical protein
MAHEEDRMLEDLKQMDLPKEILMTEQATGPNNDSHSTQNFRVIFSLLFDWNLLPLLFVDW